MIIRKLIGLILILLCLNITWLGLYPCFTFSLNENSITVEDADFIFSQNIFYPADLVGIAGNVNSRAVVEYADSILKYNLESVNVPDIKPRIIVEYADSVLNYKLEHPSFLNQPPTCVIKLQKDGVEIKEIDVGEFFDIYVGDSTDDIGIVQVRFSSDDFQDGNPAGEWTEWYDWEVSSGDWDAETKIKRWSFATSGAKEVWAEVKDTIGQTNRAYANIYAIELPPPENQPPDVVMASQFRFDGITVIPEGGIISEGIVIFKGIVSDPDGDEVRLEIELRKMDEPFTGEPTLETISDFVPSGTEVTITRYGLINADYHWRYRAKDIHGATSDWKEFGAVGNVDFTVHIVGDQPPTCIIKLQQEGTEISEIDVWEFFDIYVGDSTDDTGITHVRFSSDDDQDGVATGEWTEWYDWEVSSGDWNASTKIKRWAFATCGYKEVWAEVKDDAGQTARCSANVSANLPAAVISSPLEVTPKGPYYVGDSLTATFTIKNVGDVPIKFDVLTVGGRDPDGLVIDFEWERNIILKPNHEHTYTGELILPKKSGPYHFFIAYRTEYGYWNPSVDLAEGLTDEDRIEDFIVLETHEKYPLGGIIIPEENFPKGKGHVIPIYVPQVIDNSNQIREENGWKTIKEIEKSKLNFEWEKMVISFTPTRTNTPQGSAFSFISNFITAVNSGISRINLKITIQENSEGKFRAIVQMGDPDINTFMRNHAGELWLLQFPEPRWYFQSIFSKYVAEAFHLEPAKWNTYYAMRMQVDSAHKKDQFIYYLSLSKEGKIILTPKVYPQDKLEIVCVHEILFPYKMEPVVELTGSNYVSFAEYFINEEESRSIIKIIAPISLVPESAIIARGRSPIELRVYDSYGNVTGLVNGVIREEIPNSLYDSKSKSVIIFFPDDTYLYDAEGIDEGTYELEITLVRNGNITTFKAIDIPISINIKHRYSINWNALAMGEEGVTILIDSDGDGKFEKTFTADSELTRDEFMLQVSRAEAFPMWVVGVAIVTIIIVSMVTVVLWKKKRT
ncbi:MAG: hypothetical protein ACTSV7_09250, partial [Candidatus Baldrarchaeia archaeon]